jgi:hypothetical protein
MCRARDVAGGGEPVGTRKPATAVLEAARVAEAAYRCGEGISLPGRLLILLGPPMLSLVLGLRPRGGMLVKELPGGRSERDKLAKSTREGTEEEGTGGGTQPYGRATLTLPSFGRGRMEGLRTSPPPPGDCGAEPPTGPAKLPATLPVPPAPRPYDPAAERGVLPPLLVMLAARDSTCAAPEVGIATLRAGSGSSVATRDRGRRDVDGVEVAEAEAGVDTALL